MKLFGNRRSGGEHTGHAQPHADGEIELSEIRSDEAGDEAGAQSAARKKTLRRVLIIIGAVAAVLGAVVAAYFIWEKPPEHRFQDRDDTAQSGDDATQPDSSAKNPAVRPTATPKPGDGEDDEDDEGALVQPMTAGYRDGVFTFLLVGIDRVSRSTDTIMVVSFDTKNHTIHCVNIPRDTLINIGYSGSTPKKINAVYPGYFNTYNGNRARYENDYDSPEAYGIYGLREHIRNLLGFYVDYYVLVDIQAVEDIVDTIGGVEFDVPEEMHYFDPSQDLRINLSAGRQRLNGEDAVKLCRFRYSYAAGDLKRIEVQQSFLKAMARQLISAKNIPHLSELIEIVGREVNTDLELNNVAWLARQFLACSMDGITFQTMPLTASGGGINNISLVGVNADAWLEMVNSSLNPFVEDVKLENMNLLTYNASGGVYATNGVIAGGIDSFACLSCGTSHAPGAHLVRETEEPEEEGTGASENTPEGETGTEAETGTETGTVTEPAPAPAEPAGGTDAPPQEAPPAGEPSPETPEAPEA